MADVKLLKRWKTTAWHLQHARDLLPTLVIEKSGEFADLDLDLASLAKFEGALKLSTLELALDQLEGLGALNQCHGAFWRHLEKAARTMELHARADALHRRFNDSL